jgi:hypothetical protein
MLGVARATTIVVLVKVGKSPESRLTKVEKPLGSSSDGDVERPKTRSGYLGYVNPADWSPTELEETGEQENADESEVASRRDVSGSLGRIEAHVETDVQHGKTLGDGGPEERPTTTKRISSEDQEGQTGDHFDDAIYASGKELDFVALQTEGSEDLGRVV